MQLIMQLQGGPKSENTTFVYYKPNTTLIGDAELSWKLSKV